MNYKRLRLYFYLLRIKEISIQGLVGVSLWESKSPLRHHVSYDIRAMLLQVFLFQLSPKTIFIPYSCWHRQAQDSITFMG